MAPSNSEKLFSVTASPFIAREDVIIGLLKIDRTPPHIILIVGNAYFSLGVSGCKMNRDLGRLVLQLEKHNTKCLFVRLRDISVAKAIKVANRCYRLFEQVEKSVSCLQPIKHFCYNIYNIESNADDVIFDLLDTLDSRGKLGNYSQLNCHAETVGITRYTNSDVQHFIQTFKQ